jgi:uncharacterized membrane protein YuzA (DUF378 family)
VRRYIPLSLRYKDNAVIGNMSALISIIYGVLVGLTALYLINNINYAADAVQREANAIADVYRDSLWLKDPVRTNIETSIKNYLTTIIYVEWPNMEKGQHISIDNTHIVQVIHKELKQLSIKTQTEVVIFESIITDLKKLYDARHQRISMSDSVLNNEIWLVILIGTVLTVVINYIFGMNFYLHVATVCGVSLMAASMIFLLISLDRPFQGSFIVEPDAFRELLIDIDKSETQNHPPGNPSPIPSRKGNSLNN